MTPCGHLRIALALMPFALAACADKPAAGPAAQPVQHPPPVKNEVRKKMLPKSERGKISSLSLEDVFLLQQSGKVLFIDARPAIFHQLGHIPGALSIPAKNCDALISRHEPQIQKARAEGKTIVTYCSGLMCPDARTVSSHLSSQGYDSSVFHGGWDAWKGADMPVE